PDDPRMTSTVEEVVRRLGRGGLIHRFDPLTMPGEIGEAGLPVGAFEGAFLPCTFWLATVHARAGRTEDAEAVIRGVESVAGELGLFAEEVDVATGAFLGNMPLLFSQVEYARAVLALDEAP
ncbi:MAG: glycoside hydrolase family 15 protein, partial [Chloroflexota bacterium]|nr:glycoside hydrolase family 15 protein [Chloroflexota bacterium]